MFEQAPAAIFILRGPEHGIELANPVATQLFAGRRILGQPLLGALPDAGKVARGARETKRVDIQSYIS